MRPSKPHFNETRIEIPKRSKKEEEEIKQEEPNYNIDQNNPIDFSNKHIRWVDDDRMEKVKYF